MHASPRIVRSDKVIRKRAVPRRVALQVRDIYMGLRMGLARDFKIVRTVERMNSIIHKSTLTSRFVSMFYGELELNGVFIYKKWELVAKGDIPYERQAP